MEDIRLVEKYAVENKVMTRAAISFPKKSLNKELKRLEKKILLHHKRSLGLELLLYLGP